MRTKKTVFESKFDPNITILQFDENNYIIQTNFISNNKRILQFVMKNLLSNTIFKYASSVNNEELAHSIFENI